MMRQPLALALMLGLAQPVLSQPALSQIVVASGGLLRVQDKMTGVVTDYTLPAGASQPVGRLTVSLDECRYPSDLPTGEAFAHVTISDGSVALFAGWMVASSPALSALDHPRYDVWVLRCDTPQTIEAEGSGG
jgi:hypothetical protein